AGHATATGTDRTRSHQHRAVGLAAPADGTAPALVAAIRVLAWPPAPERTGPVPAPRAEGRVPPGRDRQRGQPPVVCAHAVRRPFPGHLAEAGPTGLILVTAGGSVHCDGRPG